MSASECMLLRGCSMAYCTWIHCNIGNPTTHDSPRRLHLPTLSAGCIPSSAFILLLCPLSLRVSKVMRLLSLCISSSLQLHLSLAFQAPSQSFIFCRGVAKKSYTKTMLHGEKRSADAWAEGINAAPAVMSDVDNVPLLDPIPDGWVEILLWQAIASIFYVHANNWHSSDIDISVFVLFILLQHVSGISGFLWFVMEKLLTQ